MVNPTIVDYTGNPPVTSEAVTGVTTSGSWQWSERAQAWFGPAYQVSWNIGDNVGHPVGPFSGGGPGPTVQCSPLVGATPYAELKDTTGAPWFYFSGRGSTSVPASTMGSGVVYLVLTEGDPSAPPDQWVNVLDYLGDVVLTNGATVVPYALDMGDGSADGDTFLDWEHRHMYGRQAGAWVYLGSIADPQQQIAVTSLSAGIPAFTGSGGPMSGADPIGDADVFWLRAQTGIGSSTFGFRVRPNGTTIIMGDNPAASVLAAGQMAIWLDPTPGATFLRVKAKDSAGTVVTGNLPLT